MGDAPMLTAGRRRMLEALCVLLRSQGRLVYQATVTADGAAILHLSPPQHEEPRHDGLP